MQGDCCPLPATLPVLLPTMLPTPVPTMQPTPVLTVLPVLLPAPLPVSLPVTPRSLPGSPGGTGQPGSGMQMLHSTEPMGGASPGLDRCVLPGRAMQINMQIRGRGLSDSDATLGGGRGLLCR